jgi:hypothetical protein
VVSRSRAVQTLDFVRKREFFGIEVVEKTQAHCIAGDIPTTLVER